MKLFYLFLIVLLSFINESYGNVCALSDSSNLKTSKCRISLEPKIHAGFIIAHSPVVLYLVNRHFAMYECSVNFLTLGNKNWHNDYRRSLWGFSYLYSDLGNKEYLGGVHAIITHFSFPLVKRKTSLFTFRLGTGAGWIEKPFNRTDNYKNVVIGSHINLSMTGAFELRKQISKRTQLTSALCINHYSNGAAKIPNLGINVLSINAGMAYQLYKQSVTKCDSNSTCSKKWKVNTIVGGGFKQTIPAGGRNYPVGLIMFNVSKYISSKGKFGFGTEYQYSEALFKQLNGAKDLASLSRVAINVCYEQMIDRLAVVMVLGTYAYSKAKEDGPIYDRLGLRYYCKNNLILNFSLKTHFANADFFDFGIGYQF